MFGMEKFHQYTYAREVEVTTDHKPLIAIWKKPLAKAPRRLQTLLLRAKNYRFDLTYKPGKEIPTADALSRAPVSEATNRELIYNIVLHKIRDDRLEQIRIATAADDSLREVMKVIMEGWPTDKQLIPAAAKPFHSYNDELTIQDGIIYRSDRVVIPVSMRKEMLTKVHAGHQGVNSCLRRARDLIFWPGMSQQIRQHVDTCDVCATYADKQGKETEVITEIPGRPWQKLGCDLFSFGGVDYVITYDYHSNFFEIDELQTLTAESVIGKLRNHFARNGVPDTIVSDNGPQYAAQVFAEFSREWGFKHEKISPGNSKANGAAEAAVKTAKRIMRKSKALNEDFHKGLLNHRNTPTEGLNTSPAQRLLGRRTKTMLPTASEKLKPGYENPQQETSLKQNMRAKAIENSGGRDLRPLKEGDSVRLQPFAPGDKEWRQATVTQALSSRSYEVQTESGRHLKRNRVHMRAKPKSSHSLMKRPSGKATSTPEGENSVTQPTNTPSDKEPPCIAPPQPEETHQPTMTDDTTKNDAPARKQVTTRSGRTIKPPTRYE